MSTPSPRPDVPTSTLPAPQPTHPVAGRTIPDEAPTFQWTAVPDAEAYQLQLAASEAFDTLYHDATVDGPTAVSLDEVLPDDATTVVWRVRVAPEAEAPWSNPASFTLGEREADDDAQFLVDAPPVPIRPISGDAIDAAGATLTWEGVPEASGYRVQVAETAAFDAPAVDLMLDQDTTLTLFDALPNDTAPLYWRVCALFPNDTEGPWSETGQFGTDPAVQEDDAPVPQRDAAAEAEASIRRSAVAGSPAREAHTSSAMVVAFTGVLLISFLITVLLVMMAI